MNERLQTILNKKWFLPTVSAVGGSIVGYAAGYLRTRSQYDRIEAQLEKMEQDTDWIEAETERIEQYTLDFRDAAIQAEVDRRVANILASRLSQELGYIEEHKDPEDSQAMNDLVQDHPSSGRRSRLVSVPDLVVTVPDPEPEIVTTNVFDSAGDEWDYKTEVESRTSEAPYMIHVDEYVADEMGWDNQSTLTWYEKDQVLCDSHDVPIHNHKEVVGELRFGHGSNDPNAVYVRNERLEAEYEVLRDPRSYEEVVLGEEADRQLERDELRHSAVLRMRRSD